MTLKTYKPYTKSTRGTVLVDKKNLWKGSPFKSLTKGKASSGGRNNLGKSIPLKQNADQAMQEIGRAHV